MKRGNWRTMLAGAMLPVVIAACAALLHTGAFAEESGDFKGTLTASGSREKLPFLPGREVGIFSIEGHVNLSHGLGETKDFWATWVGLWDTDTGGVVRCVWRDLHGHRIFGVLSGTRLKEGAVLSGEFVGGTGPFEGIQGDFRFTWTLVSYDTGDDVLSGYATDIHGTYRIP